jgi:hypothetical protein
MFAIGKISLFENECRFRRTNIVIQGMPLYEEISTRYYWYLDNLHQNHHEVFNHTGQHIGEADLQGIIDYARKDNNKTINL